MRQRVSAPDAEALCGLLAKDALGIGLSGIGADEGHREVEYRAALNDEADASKQAVDLPVGSETVAVDQRKSIGLFDQVFVCHFVPPGTCTIAECDKCVRNRAFVKLQGDLYAPDKYGILGCSIAELFAPRGRTP